MDLWKSLLELVLGLLTKKEVEVSIPIETPAVEAEFEPKKQPSPSDIDWTNPNWHVTEHFLVKDCLMLHSWNRLGTELDGANFEKLITLCNKMEEIRGILGCSINVHCMYRSSKYNIEQKILLPTGMDVHAMSLACDFDCNGKYTIQEVKDILVPRLEGLGIRIEFGTTTWVHVDLHSVGPSGRYFRV